MPEPAESHDPDTVTRFRARRDQSFVSRGAGTHEDARVEGGNGFGDPVGKGRRDDVVVGKGALVEVAEGEAAGLGAVLAVAV